MAKKLVLFGVGKIGQVIYHHFKTDSEFTVIGFTTDRAHVPASAEHDGLPVVPFDEVEKHFAPADHTLFVAIGYHDLNRLRATRLAEAIAKGYSTTSYVNSQCRHTTPDQIGRNCFVMSADSLQPHATLGDNCFIWSNTTIGHHTTLGNHCWVTSGTAIGGHSTISDYCFFGLNATVGHGITLGNKCFIGADTLITKDAEDESVFITPDTPKYRLTSEQFLTFTKL